MSRILLMIAFFCALPGPALGQTGEQAQAAATFLRSGNPEQAVITAQRALKTNHLDASERQSLLTTIARAELMRTTHQQFQGVKAAIQALDALINEFPDSADAPEFRWKQAWLWWKSGHLKQAIAAAREIIAEDQQAVSLRRIWLLMARIHLQLNKYAYARSDLLQYGLQVRSNSRDQALGMAWMATVDRGESRSDAAFKNLHTVYRKWPDVITTEPQLFASYIDLLESHRQGTAALKLANAFIRQYSHAPQSALVRFIRANIHARAQQTIPTAIKEYAMLADRQAETSIGRKAFMRKLMLEFRQEKRRDKLLPALVTLKKIAAANQLSDIEDEAMLDMARLWTRISYLSVSNASPKAPKAMQSLPALEAYARASTSPDQHIADAARQEGAVWLKKYTSLLLEQKQWLQAVTIWRHYPQLRPTAHSAPTLRLGIAHAMRMLMLFEPAEEMLEHLYAVNRMSIIGQRMMMERAKLWMDQHDPDGVKKIMRWLNRHEFSIFRPEMLLIVARMQLDQQQAELARQTLVSVKASDIAVESRPSYWQTNAEIAETLSEWRRAARAWGQYRNSKGADSKMGLRRQAAALFTAGEFAEALKRYQQIPEANHDSGWQYHVGVCQLRSGAVKQGTALLQQLAGSKSAGKTVGKGVGKTGFDHYISLAKLALADQQAKQLLGEQP